MSGNRPWSETSDRNGTALHEGCRTADEHPHRPAAAPLKILRPREVVVKVGLSLMQLWRLQKAKRFPKPVRLGRNSVGYLEHEIDEWIRRRIAERDGSFCKRQPKPVTP